MKTVYENLFSYSIKFFNTLDRVILEELLKHSYIKKYSKSDILFYENDKSKYIYYLISGTIKFYKIDRFDNEIFLYELYGPKLIFDISQIDKNRYIKCFANAEFSQDSKVLLIEHSWFENNFLKNKSLCKNVMLESFETITKLQCIINRDVVFDGSARVAHFLATNLKTYNKLKKNEIAYMLHIQPETLSRIIKKMVRNNIIETQNGSIFIKDLQKLKEIYE